MKHVAAIVIALVVLAVTGIVDIVGIVGVAHAKTNGVVSYPYEQVFPTAVRFLRIDEKLTIVEKDEDSGYILFEVKDEGKVYQGSFEVARVRDQEGRNASKLLVRIEDRPAYMEQGLIDRFGQKLYHELGDPKPPPPPKPTKKKKPAPKPDPADKNKIGEP